MKANPFTYGNPITDASRFVGRARQIEQVYSRLRNTEFESSALVGERRIGKTSLLYHLADPNVRRAHGLDPQRYHFLYADLALLDATTTPARLWQYLMGRLKTLLPTIPFDAPIDAAALDNFALAEFFDQLDAQGQSIVLLLDEFENVTRNANFAPDFFYGLRSLAIHHKLALITSSRRELIELTHSNEIRSSPFFNIFASISVRLFTDDEARLLIANALDGNDIAFDEREIAALLDMAGNSPFFLQAACHFLYEAYAQEFAPDAREKFWRAEFRRQAAPHLAEYWRHSDVKEKIVLAALALLEQPHSPAARAWDAQPLRALCARSERVLAHLDKRGLVRRRDAQYAPFSALFGEWIVNALPEQTLETEAGETIPLTQALREALAQADWQSEPETDAETRAELPAGLSPRELEVLELVASGLSDAQVAAKLVLSPRTVSTHLQSIYNKLGVNSRVAATRFALEHRLISKK
jgi:DNA-binding CsgD family transcriptional regulator